jgi:hypothetical protein
MALGADPKVPVTFGYLTGQPAMPKKAYAGCKRVANRPRVAVAIRSILLFYCSLESFIYFYYKFS